MNHALLLLDAFNEREGFLSAYVESIKVGKTNIGIRGKRGFNIIRNVDTRDLARKLTETIYERLDSKVKV